MEPQKCRKYALSELRGGVSNTLMSNEDIADRGASSKRGASIHCDRMSGGL